MLHFTHGDMFETDADILINTVNCVGVMGKGVALAFKRKFPEMFKQYRKDCENDLVKPGEMHVWQNLFGSWVINFPTKRHWRNKSRYEDIQAGLEALRHYLQGYPEAKVALPALGCGHGGLDWKKVSQMIREHLGDLENEIWVFEPKDSRVIDQRSSINFKTIASAQNSDLEPLKQIGVDHVYTLGNLSLLNGARLLMLFKDDDPTEMTFRVIEKLQDRSFSLMMGYRPKLQKGVYDLLSSNPERNLILIAAQAVDPNALPADLRKIMEQGRLLLLSLARPGEKRNTEIAEKAFSAALRLAEVTVVLDENPTWLFTFSESSRVPTHFYFANPDNVSRFGSGYPLVNDDDYLQLKPRFVEKISA